MTDWEIAQVEGPAGPESLAQAEWRPVHVPGVVQNSPFGLPKDELYRLQNTERVQWMSDCTWAYRTRFRCPHVAADEEAVLRFRGVDYLCDVRINGQVVLEHEGMWSWFEVSLAGLPAAENELVVVIHPLENFEAYPQEHLKVRFVRGWDWAPKMITMGIWDDVELIARKRLRVTHAWVETELANQQRADCIIHVRLSERIDFGAVEVTLAGQTQEYPIVDSDTLRLPMRVTNPPLWWPNGMGPATLVDLELTLRVDGRETELFVTRTGLRSVNRVPAAGQRPEDAPLQMVINGRRVFLRGANWAPADCCFADLDRDRYALYLRQLAANRYNILRVWGGGFIEKEPFYDLADELGLMVMQEFPLACEPVPESERFLRILTAEARNFLPRLNRHPSIVLWTGGNEHIHYWDMLESGTPVMESTKGDILSRQGFFFDRKHYVAGVPIYENLGLKQMASLANELDGSRPFEPTSGMEGEGEPHGIWSWNPKIGDWRMRDYDSLYDYWNDQREHFYSEVGVDSITTRAAIEYVLQTREPAVPEPGDPVWTHHKAFGACWPIDRTHEPNLRSDLWLDLASIDRLFGRLGDLDDLIAASHWMQAEGGRYIVEELRRKMPHSCGVIWWGCNEPWPNLAGNQLIDYFGTPHPVLAWKGNAFRATILSLRYKHCVARAFKPELWISHDGRGPFDGTYSCTVEAVDTGELEEYQGVVTCPEYASVFVKRLDYVRLAAGKRLWVTLSLRDLTGAQVHRNTYLFASDEDEAPLRPLLPRIRGLLDETMAGQRAPASGSGGAGPGRAAQ